MLKPPMYRFTRKADQIDPSVGNPEAQLQLLPTLSIYSSTINNGKGDIGLSFLARIVGTFLLKQFPAAGDV